MNKSVKITLYPDDSYLSREKIINELFIISKITRNACNKAINLQFVELMNKNNAKDKGEPIISDKILYGKSFRAYLEQQMKDWMPGVSTANVAATNTFVMGKNVFDTKKILSGEKSLSNFRSDMPIYLHNKSYTISAIDNKYIVIASLFNLTKQKELGCKQIKFCVRKPEEYQLAILNRIIIGEFKQGVGQIKYNKGSNTWHLIISYSFINHVKNNLSQDNILGIDLGITKVAVMSIYNCETNSYKRIRYDHSVIDGAELRHFRQVKEAKRRSLAISTKTASQNKCGHGTKQRCSDLNKINNKVKRFRDTYNHKISRYIVDFASRNNCGIIQMEDLTGYHKKKYRESFLKQWSYYDLQSKIVYKSKEMGIIVLFVNAAYTSQRCSICGCIDSENRDCKRNQAEFNCIQCGRKMNADINASRNIALPNIDQIIANSVQK